MLICDNFIVIHLPKSGSSFVRKVVKDVFLTRDSGYCLELIMPNIKGHNRPNDHHGTFSQIPSQYLNREIVSVLRNPFEKLISSYLYRWWVEHPPLENDQLFMEFSNFPNLDFRDFIRLNELSARRKLAEYGTTTFIGNQTIQFIRMYFKRPQHVLENLTSVYVNSETDYRDDIAEISFLRQENLNFELAEFLNRKGFSSDEVNYCREHPRVNEGSNIRVKVNSLWTHDSIIATVKAERLLLTILKSLGMEVTLPVPESYCQNKLCDNL